MILKYIIFLFFCSILTIPAKCQIFDFFNRPPTIDEIDEPVEILENSGSQSIILTGVSYGNDRYYQKLTITAVSSKSELIPHPSIYYDQSSIANLNFTPAQDQNGSTKIKITLDDGQRINNITEMTFKIIVVPVNGRPSFKLQSGPPAIEEGAGEIKIKDFAFDIDDGDPDEDQKLEFITSIKQITNNLTFEKEPSIDKKSGELKYEINPNGYGEATISVVLKDDEGTENGGNDTSLESTFVIIVIGENDPPTLDPISDPDPISEDAAQQQIALTGISAGVSENQPLTVSATSSNAELISGITINYMSPSTTGLVNYHSNANKFGTSLITVTVDDGQSDNNTVTQSFKVEVLPAADTPSITDAVITGGGQNTSGLVISRNPADGEEVTHFKITNIINGTLYLNDGKTQIKNGKFINYAQGHAGLKFTPSGGNKDPGSFYVQAATGKGNQFLGGAKVQALIIIANDAPTLDPISNPEPISEDAAQQQIALTGISAGDSENQTLTVSATSSNVALISEFTVNYTSPSTTGSVRYQPNANKFGASLITVTVDDGQSQNNTVSRSFKVEINPVADTPSITNAVITGGGQNTSGLVISRNPSDGEEVTHFKITNILNGTLYLNNGTTKISNGRFITYAQGNSGLKFTPSGGNKNPGSFNIQAATGKENQFLGGAKVLAEIIIENDPPKIDSKPLTVIDVASHYSYKILASDPDPKDHLTFTFNLPQRIQSWLKAVDNHDNSALISGTPPSGAHGIYNIYIKVEDPYGQYDEQLFKLEVKKLNNKPVLTAITRNIDEDEPLDFSLSLFKGHYSDLDGDELKEIKIAKIPQKGRLLLNGLAVSKNKIIASQELAKLRYVPDKDYHGADIFDWNASDGKEYALYPQQVSILVAPVNDAPTLNAITSPGPVREGAPVQQIALTGISAGVFENQSLKVTATSNDLDLISEITVNYSSPSATGSVSYVANANKFGTTIITVTIDDGQSQNNTITRSFTVVINPVADTPSITKAVIKGSGQNTSGLVISRNPADGEEVTHFKITNILNGTLYLNNGTTQISNGRFVTYAQGNSGLKFLHSHGHKNPGSFNIQAATGKGNQFLGGAKVLAEITIDNDPPAITSIPAKVIEISKYYSYNVLASDPNPNDQLTFTFIIPERIRFWLRSEDNNDNSALLFGTPPSGSEGIYDIYIKVEDPFGQNHEQNFKLEVKKLNNKPELTPIARNMDEDETLNFNLNLFKDHFFDLDGDDLQEIKIINTPQKGRLLLDGIELSSNDIVDSSELAKLIYIPEQHYHGLDIFDWSGSDGKDFSLVPQRVSIFIASINDLPEIINLESTAITFEYGDDGKKLTDSSIVFDADGDKIEKAIVRIAENYVRGEDSIYYEHVNGITYHWQDTLGELTLRGLENPIVYENAIRSLMYINLNRLSPTNSYRLFEFVLYDADTLSLPFTRFINFENTFVELEIPTGFTPNNDGVNDTWEIGNLGRYEDIKVSVFSRSGKTIYNSEYHREWDGTYNGNLVPAGPYYYLINIDKFKKVYRGAVYVLR